jgi:hypothetical protein
VVCEDGYRVGNLPGAPGNRTLLNSRGCRVPHPCAFCAQGWDSTPVSNLRISRHPYRQCQKPGPPNNGQCNKYRVRSTLLWLSNRKRPRALSQTYNPHFRAFFLPSIFLSSLITFRRARLIRVW